MTAQIPNIAKGRFARYADLPLANDAIVWVILASAGLESNATILDYDTLAAILAAANDEATFTGYARVTATSVTVTVDDTNNRTDVDAADPTWTPTTAEAIGLIVAVYEPDTTSPSDSNKAPLFTDDAIAMTTATSGLLTYGVATPGFGRAA
jgi:hypothetical protein